MNRNAWLLVSVLTAILVVGFQFKIAGDLRREMTALRNELRGTEGPEEESPRSISRPVSSLSNPAAGLQSRVASLEQTVAELVRAAEVLTERGMVPPSEEYLARVQQRFFDTTASDRDRLRGLQFLRRNRQIDDQVVAHAVNWLQTSTNANTRRQLLNNLDGLTNAALKQPLMAMLETETSGNVREELVDVLAEFRSDPAVESRLWDLALNDPESDVRREAEQALLRGPVSPERIQKLQQLASSPDASVEERLLSLRALNRADVPAPEAVAQLAGLAHNSTDPVLKARLFSAFDGINDPALMTPLVYGLQGPNPVVRQEAVDALGTFSSDPRIQEWLYHVIENDADSRVKREAHRVLERLQRQNRRGG